MLTGDSGCFQLVPARLFSLSLKLVAQIRIWNIYEPNKSVAVGKCRSRTGKRLHVLSCTYNSEGKMIAAGCSEGVIQVSLRWKRGPD